MTDGSGNQVPTDASYTVTLPSTINGQSVSWRTGSASGTSVHTLSFSGGEVGKTVYLINDSSSHSINLDQNRTKSIAPFVASAIMNESTYGTTSSSVSTDNGLNYSPTNGYTIPNSGVVQVPVGVGYNPNPSKAYNGLPGQTVTVHGLSGLPAGVHASFSSTSSLTSAVTDSNGNVYLYVTLPKGWSSSPSNSLSVELVVGNGGSTSVGQLGFVFTIPVTISQ